MRRPNTVAQHQPSFSIPRGWIVLGAALGSWALFIALSTSLGQLFMYVLGAI